MALLILALLQRIFLMSSLMLLLMWLTLISTLFPYTTLFRSRPHPLAAHPHDLLRFHPRNGAPGAGDRSWRDRKSTRLNSSHVAISYAVFCLKKKILSLLQRIYLMSSLMLLLVWLIFFMVLIK